MWFEDYQDVRQQPTVQMIPPQVISRYVNQWITTSIPGYGEVVAYVLEYNPRTGMVSLFMYREGRVTPQYIQVHFSDLIGIAPYYGPIPPRPRPRPRPPRPRPPWGTTPGPGTPGQPGTGLFPWLWGQFF
ncbi:hypothetical protein [Bacillus sp. FJAT-44742]|uniref:hypothetical protein n=1 Tax=Bacillus sp. FJAT-44742 TaxID=2014005 RepID=UPI000C23E30A|nr:hypothetical protein [Bacillus sp. FJAT-44742]